MLKAALDMPRIVTNGIVQHLQQVEQMIRASESISLPKVTDGLHSLKRLVDVFA